ncbi:MAG: hypothetical protein ABIP55_13055 [Tepidisphaeraceae bacterium]
MRSPSPRSSCDPSNVSILSPRTTSTFDPPGESFALPRAES